MSDGKRTYTITTNLPKSGQDQEPEPYSFDLEAVGDEEGFDKLLFFVQPYGFGNVRDGDAPYFIEVRGKDE